MNCTYSGFDGETDGFPVLYIDASHNKLYNLGRRNVIIGVIGMEWIIRQIRNVAGISQQQLADYMGVSFATVNRWENGRSYPNQLAQNRLFDFCKEYHISLNHIIDLKIRNEVEKVSRENKNRIVLYHGSKSGLSGKIAPVSRTHCDFGKGFYLGTDPLQPLTLICDFEKSKFYVVSLDLKGLKILNIQADIEWAMLVAYHRGKMEDIQGTAFYEKYQKMAEGFDVIIGYIANDRMFVVLDNFFQGTITDTALVQSLAALKLGQQYVCITQKACDQLNIEAEIPFSFLERKCLQEISAQNRAEGISLANDICRKHRRDGRFFDEILEEAHRGAK